MKKLISLFIILSVLIFPPPLWAVTASIVNFNAVEANGLIKISARLKGAFDKDFKDTLQNGMTTVFTYYLELKKSRPFYHVWYLGLDDKIYSREIKKIAKYDVLKKEYKFMMLDGQDITEKTLTSLDEVYKAMSEINDLTVVPTDFLNKGESYYVRIKAEMKSLKLWFPFNYFFFFFPMLTNFETTWQESTPIVIEK